MSKLKGYAVVPNTTTPESEENRRKLNEAGIGARVLIPNTSVASELDTPNRILLDFAFNLRQIDYKRVRREITEEEEASQRLQLHKASVEALDAHTAAAEKRAYKQGWDSACGEALNIEQAVLEARIDELDTPEQLVDNFVQNLPIKATEIGWEAIGEQQQELIAALDRYYAAHTAAAVLEAKREVQPSWWITTDFFRNGGSRMLGPFNSKELALSVRRYVERDTKRTYAVDQLTLSKAKDGDAN